MLDGLIELYKEKNGKDPEDSDVQKWIETLQQANAEAAAPPPPNDYMQDSAGAGNTKAVLGSCASATLGGMTDALLGKTKTSAELGLPSFGLQASLVPKVQQQSIAVERPVAVVQGTPVAENTPSPDTSHTLVQLEALNTVRHLNQASTKLALQIVPFIQRILMANWCSLSTRLANRRNVLGISGMDGRTTCRWTAGGSISRAPRLPETCGKASVA